MLLHSEQPPHYSTVSLYLLQVSHGEFLSPVPVCFLFPQGFGGFSDLIIITMKSSKGNGLTLMPVRLKVAILF